MDATLAQLDSLPVPAGVKAQDFLQLKGSLRAALLASGQSRFVSQVPTAAAGAVTDLRFTAGDNGDHLAWTYVNRGDYDQNGVVTINDLTPLGTNIHKNTASADWASKAIAADGDSNGEINLADLTPIGQGMQAVVEGYHLQTSAMPTVEASWNDVQDAVLNQSVVNVGVNPLRVFDVQLTAPVNLAYYRVAPFGAGQVGPGSNYVQYHSPVPQIVSVTPKGGKVGARVTLNPTLSGPAATTFLWNFGGGASPNTSADQAPAVALAAVPGSYSASLTASNSKGSSSYNFTLLVKANKPPLAAIYATPLTGSVGAPVALDASPSTDPDGSIVKVEWDLDGNGTFETDDGTVETQSMTLPSPAGSVGIILRVTDDNGATAVTGPLTLTSVANQPPMARFTATPQSGLPGAPVQLDASGSNDPDGSIVTYEWDLDGDGVFELDNGAVKTQTTTLPAPQGSVSVSLRVTDNSGATATTRVTLSSYPPGWQQLTVDHDGGQYTSLAVVNGNPAITYTGGSGSLTYAYCDAVDGSSAWHTVVVDGGANWSAYSSLAVINGCPAISYYSYNQSLDAGSLNYAYSNTLDGSSGWRTRIVNDFGDVGEYTSLAEVDGRPAISYFDLNQVALGFAYSSQADGAGGWDSLTVDNAGNDGFCTSLAVVQGCPAISYVEGNVDHGTLKYARSALPGGTSGWSTVGVDNGGDGGFQTSLCVVNGRPAIAYFDAGSSHLKYAHSAQLDGSSGWTSVTVDSVGQVGFFPALAVINGHPAISYYEFDDYSTGELKYAASTSVDGANPLDWASAVVDSGGERGRFTSLAAVGGLAAISYWDKTNDCLRYAVLHQ